jgi:shikimate kinase
VNNIISVGMPASGKSTIGVILAKVTGKSFLDTDLLIQERQDDLLQRLIDRNGMESFLQMEEEALRSIDLKNAVIATGGSAVHSPIAMEHLGKTGKIIYLQLPLESIKKRLHDINSRGIAMEKGETLFDLFQRRIPLYEKYADIVIDTQGLSVEETIQHIILQID